MKKLFYKIKYNIELFISQKRKLDETILQLKLTKAELEYERKRNDALVNQYGSDKANSVLKNILERPIRWFDYEEQEESYQREYYNRAKELLENPVFQNEFNAFVVDMTKAVLTETDDDKLLNGDEDKVLLIKYSLNGLKAFEERIKSIKIPEKVEREREEDLTEAI